MPAESKSPSRTFWVVLSVILICGIICIAVAATLSFAKTSPKVRRFSYPENAILCSPPHFACREWLKLFISHQQNKVAVLYTSLPQQCNQPAHSTTPPMLWTTTPMSCLQLEGSRLGEGCSAHWPGSMSH